MRVKVLLVLSYVLYTLPNFNQTCNNLFVNIYADIFY